MGTNPLLRFMVPDPGDVNGIEALAAHVAELDDATFARLADAVDAADITDVHRRRIIDVLLAHRPTPAGLRLRWAHRYAVDAVDAAQMLDPDEDNGIRYARSCTEHGPPRVDVWSAIVSTASLAQLEALCPALLNPTAIPELGDLRRVAPEVVDVFAGELARRVHDGVLLTEALLTLSTVDAVARIDRDAAASMLKQMPMLLNWDHPVDVGPLDATVSVFIDLVIPHAPLGLLANVARQIRTVPWAVYPNARRIFDALEQRVDAGALDSLRDQLDPQIGENRRFSDLVAELEAPDPPSWDDVLAELEHLDDRRLALTDAARVVHATNPALTLTQVIDVLSCGSVPSTVAALRHRDGLSPVELGVIAALRPLCDAGLDGLLWILDTSDDRAVTVATWLNIVVSSPAPGSVLDQAAHLGLLDDATISELSTAILRASTQHWAPAVIDAMTPWITAHFDGERAALAVELSGSATFGELAALVDAAT
jgi:hypothetical protein